MPVIGQAERPDAAYAAFVIVLWMPVLCQCRCVIVRQLCVEQFMKHSRGGVVRPVEERSGRHGDKLPRLLQKSSAPIRSKGCLPDARNR